MSCKYQRSFSVSTCGYPWQDHLSKTPRSYNWYMIAGNWEFEWRWVVQNLTKIMTCKTSTIFVEQVF